MCWFERESVKPLEAAEITERQRRMVISDGDGWTEPLETAEITERQRWMD